MALKPSLTSSVSFRRAVCFLSPFPIPSAHGCVPSVLMLPPAPSSLYWLEHKGGLTASLWSGEKGPKRCQSRRMGEEVQLLLGTLPSRAALNGEREDEIPGPGRPPPTSQFSASPLHSIS